MLRYGSGLLYGGEECWVSEGSLSGIQSSAGFSFHRQQLPSRGESSVLLSKVETSPPAQQLDARLIRTANQSNGLCNSRMVSIIEKHLDANYFELLIMQPAQIPSLSLINQMD